jgi:hypothetical protein
VERDIQTARKLFNPRGLVVQAMCDTILADLYLREGATLKQSGFFTNASSHP